MNLTPDLSDKTLETVEKNVWPALNESELSYVIKTCHALRKKKLKDYSVEDLRIMIGQDIGLEHLIPLAIEVLTKNILAEGDFYEGDLLQSVLTRDRSYWDSAKDNWQKIHDLFLEKQQILKDYETTPEIKKVWFDGFDKFKSYGQGDR